MYATNHHQKQCPMEYKTITESSMRCRMNILTVFPNKVSPIGSPSFLCCMEICISFCTYEYDIS